MRTKKGFLFLLLLPLLLFIHVFVVDHEHAHAEEMHTAKTSAQAAQNPAQTTATSTLVGDVNNVINNDPDGLSVSVTVIDLNTGKEYDAGSSTTLYKAASIAKVLAAVDYLHEVELGQASLGENINGTSAQQLLQAMIEVSDDNAWADINNFLGDQQQTYADSLGLSSFTGGEYNTMTSSDMAKLLEELYDGKLLNSTDTALLYNYMANTTSTNLIQAALPSDATVYHKYGQLWGYLNDAAIVRYQGHDFALVIFTNNTDGTTDEYNDQVNLIHNVTQAVYTDLAGNS